ncbi:hypothetical protein DFS34DRAFT_437596 [Phlyctochytrium arcticum]|nr:hypothetical protein DFS34DRAFT_437596 [Phlyctochytrium arcticum]
MQNYESLQTKVEMATGRTTTVMADIQAKMRDIRKHLKLAGPEEVTAASGLSESGIPSVAEAAESPSPPMAVVPDTTATKVPSDPVSLPKPAKVASPVQSSLLGSSSSAIPFFAPPNQPVELKSESTVLNKSALEPSESHEAEQSHKPEQKEPETFSKIAPEMTLMSSDKSDGTNSAKPVESSEISPAPQEKAKPSADPILGNTLDFETDLMAIMNNFGF